MGPGRCYHIRMIYSLTGYVVTGYDGNRIEASPSSRVFVVWSGFC